MHCSDCDIDMEYSHTAPRPNGYALVYECPDCGATDTADADASDLRRR